MRVLIATSGVEPWPHASDIAPGHGGIVVRGENREIVQQGPDGLPDVAAELLEDLVDIGLRREAFVIRFILVHSCSRAENRIRTKPHVCRVWMAIIRSACRKTGSGACGWLQSSRPARLVQRRTARREAWRRDRPRRSAWAPDVVLQVATPPRGTVATSVRAEVLDLPAGPDAAWTRRSCFRGVEGRQGRSGVARRLASPTPDRQRSSPCCPSRSRVGPRRRVRHDLRARHPSASVATRPIAPCRPRGEACFPCRAGSEGQGSARRFGLAVCKPFRVEGTCARRRLVALSWVCPGRSVLSSCDGLIWPGVEVFDLSLVLATASAD